MFSIITMNSPFNLKFGVFVETLAVSLLLSSEASIVNFNVTHRYVQLIIFLCRIESIRSQILVKDWPLHFLSGCRVFLSCQGVRCCMEQRLPPSRSGTWVFLWSVVLMTFVSAGAPESVSTDHSLHLGSPVIFFWSFGCLDHWKQESGFSDCSVSGRGTVPVVGSVLQVRTYTYPAEGNSRKSIYLPSLLV